MRQLTSFVFMLCLLVGSSFSKDLVKSANPGTRTAIVFDNSDILFTHSIFFKLLEARGHKLTFLAADDKALSFEKYGEFLYDNIVLFTPEVEDFGGRVSSSTFIKFIDNGGNLIVAASSNLADPLREIASDCGVEFGDADTFVFDHFNYDSSDFSSDHTLLVVDNILENPIITGKKKYESPVLFRGIAQKFSDGNRHELLVPVLKASGTAYSGSLDQAVQKVKSHATESDIVLISAFQARNNARVIFSGSLEFFSNNFFLSAVKKEDQNTGFARSSNQQLADALIAWFSKQSGFLRTRNVFFHRVGETDRPSLLTIKDDIEYSVVIEEWNGKEWIPFQADDVQLEFVMLDPYVRLFLKHDGKGNFSSIFKIPDVYGVFTLNLEYERQGYSWVHVKEVIPVRPYRHNQYERFIFMAYPYYASTFSMLAGLFLFSAVYLYHRDRKN